MIKQARELGQMSDFDWGCFYLNLLIEYQSINRISLRNTMKSPLILLIDTNWHHHFMHVAPDVALCVHEQLTIEIVILRRQYADKHTFNLRAEGTGTQVQRLSVLREERL